MPTPIQSSSVTAKLRSFFRLRGRQIFALDETVVPTTQVEDLTNAPYRASHQVRFQMGVRQALKLGDPTYWFINLSPVGLSPINLVKVPGVAVLESIKFYVFQDFAPGAAETWEVSLASHQGILASIEFAGTVQAIGSNVDNAINTGAAAGVVNGQVPVNLNFTEEAIGGAALGTILVLAQHRVSLATPRTVTELVPKGGGIVIGDNVALLVRGTTTPTAGQVVINVQGSYYPLARS